MLQFAIARFDPPAHGHQNALRPETNRFQRSHAFDMIRLVLDLHRAVTGQGQITQTTRHQGALQRPTAPPSAQESAT